MLIIMPGNRPVNDPGLKLRGLVVHAVNKVTLRALPYLPHGPL